MNIDLIENYFQERYSGDDRCKAVGEELKNSCVDFVKSGVADSNFSKELCSGWEKVFWSRVSEALLSKCLKERGLIPRSSQSDGPDFYVIDNGKKIWGEVICPEPKGLPTYWTEAEIDEPINFPHKQILLRWTSAIKEKTEKLLGSYDDKVKGYIEKGIVSSEDGYIIAVNGCKLRSGNPFPELYGISQFPFAVEAVFPVGPYQIKIDPDTLKKTSEGHQRKPLIAKPKGNPVPVYTFLDARFQPISAVWAVDMDGTSAIGNSEPMAVVHNPNAKNPISTGFLPAHNEYVASLITTEEYELKRFDGNLVNQKR